MGNLRTAAKSEQFGGRKWIGEASVAATYVSETIDRGLRNATLCSGR